VHPYDLRFFRRDKVIPNLGFDELQGMDVFDNALRVGPYVSDEALADYIMRLQDNSTEPLFVFAITIEAHGPWDEGRFKDMSNPPKLESPPDWGGDGVASYLTHLRNTDLMMKTLAGYTREEGARPRVLAVYGDHVGCIPENRCDSVETDYVVWVDDAGRNRRQDIGAENLGEILLNACRHLH
jgi:phosphoglycerol transferase MdoB-like AlkP superfamily enzyme